MNVLIKGIPPTLPEGWCPSSEQDRVNSYFDGAQFQFLSDVGNSFYNFGDSTPSPENRTFPWLRTVSGRPDRWYVYVGGLWLARHPIPAGDSLRQLWVGTPNDLWSYDGGNGTDPSVAANVSLTAGSFWQVDSDFAGVFPIGVGTINGTAVAVGGTGGAATVTQTIDQMPAHTHDIGVEVSALTGSSEANRLRDYSGDVEYETTSENKIARVRSTGGGQPMTIIPPYRGIYFIKRTIRQYYAIPG